MKDAKGHGSNPRGGASAKDQRSYAGLRPRGTIRPEVFGKTFFTRQGVTTSNGSTATGHFAAPAGSPNVLGPFPSDKEAQAALAQGGAKSASVPIHSGAAGRSDGDAGNMKMSPELFSALSAAVKPHIASTADPSHSPTRQRWDALWKSGFDTRKLYNAGLNDAHIDTALRRIQSKG